LSCRRTSWYWASCRRTSCRRTSCRRMSCRRTSCRCTICILGAVSLISVKKLFFSYSFQFSFFCRET
jgi:hypothetical protein